MTTVFFVHRTGVREARYVQQFELVRRWLTFHRPDIEVVPRAWGDVLGVPSDIEASVPYYAETGGGDPIVDDWHDGRWILVEADPLYELRLLGAMYGGQDTEDSLLFAYVAQERLATFDRWAAGLRESPRILKELGRTGLDHEQARDGYRCDDCALDRSTWRGTRCVTPIRP